MERSVQKGILDGSGECAASIRERKATATNSEIPLNVMTFKLGNPPVIEAWIRAAMASAPESEWNWSDVFEMLSGYGDEYSELESLPEFTPTAKGLDKNQLPEEIQIHVAPRYVRTRSADRTKTVQVGRHELLVIHGRANDQPYPGFGKLFGAFLDAVGRYREHVPTIGVASVELHYADLIVIPDLYTEQREISDYFVGAPDFPAEPFGGMAGVSWSALLSCPESQDFAQVALQMQPPDGNDGRFRLDWHCWCPELPPDDAGAIENRLHSAHNYLNSCFRAICKEPVWNLFDPS